MIENNIVAGINTDYEIQTILNNFSDDFIAHTIKSGLDYRFRPFALRSPNYPQVLNGNFDNIKLNSTGFDDIIEKKRMDCMEQIIETMDLSRGCLGLLLIVRSQMINYILWHTIYIFYYAQNLQRE